MAKMGYKELTSYVSNVVTKAKLSNDTFSVTRDNVALLVDKIGKIFTLDTQYTIDKLNRFDGEYLSYGKTIEEWQQDLIMVENYDADGSHALSPHNPTYRPAFYSYTLGRKKIPTSIKNNDLERAVHFEEQFNSLVSMQVKRLGDSMAQYRYAVKREMIAKLIALCEEEMPQASDSPTAYAINTAFSVNDIVVDNASTPAHWYIVVKAIANTNTKNLATAVADGLLVELDLITEIAKPVDTSTGEAFIKQVKADIERASDSSEGFSLNGNSLGATEGLCLIVRQGIIPELEVETYAGAFNKSDLAVPADIVVVKDFGSASSDYYAVLMDNRGMRLHNTYNATRENFNGDGDFLNLFRHTEDTAWISRNTFIKVYKVPSV